ncbi:MAG TPA: hypothetical protein VFP32_03215 [Candidatus Saccharimonadales bacterium]|nr:hypothetical protein [Candidatus Saccharimonadales bacterium]
MPKTAAKPIIAVDVDEVLAVNAAGFVEYSNKRWGTDLKVEDYHEHWAELWQSDEEETERRAIEYHYSGVHRNLEPIDKAREVLTKLAKDYRLIVLTSRRVIIEQDTRDWLDANFPGIFHSVKFAGIFDKFANDRMNLTKADQLKRLEADYFIDDQPRHCLAAAEAGITALLFGDYKWNRNLELPSAVTWVKNWQEVVEFFEKE